MKKLLGFLLAAMLSLVLSCPIEATTLVQATPVPDLVIEVHNLAGIPPAELQKAITAIQVQVDRDLYPVWGVRATLIIPDKEDATASLVIDDHERGNSYSNDVNISGGFKPDVWHLFLVNYVAPCLCFGEHTMGQISMKDFIAASFVYMPTTWRYGDKYNTNTPWTMVASHEVMEMLVDPTGQSKVPMLRGFMAVEICDDVNNYGYLIDGIAMQDFLYPAYFTDGAKGPYDYLGVRGEPFEMELRDMAE